MKHEFILNPAAGKKKNIRLAEERIRAACRKAGVDFRVTYTECAGDAVRITRGIVERGEETRLYAVGGDGTLFEVVQAAAGAEHVAVTNLPAGTGNDFLKLFSQNALRDFWDLDGLLKECRQRALDVMDCNGTLGVNIICAGVDARVAADVDRFKALPLIHGKGAYVLALAQNVLFKGIARDMTVRVGEMLWDKPTAILCICNGRYYGGGFLPMPDALPDDGVLDGLLVPKVSLPTFARFVGDYSTGKYADHPQLITPFHTGEPITFASDRPITAVVDGEVLRAKRFEVKLSEKKLNFFWPKQLEYRREETETSLSV